MDFCKTIENTFCEIKSVPLETLLWVSRGFRFQLCPGFRVSGVGCAKGWVFSVQCLGFEVLGFVFRVSEFGIRVSGFGIRDSGFGIRNSGIRIRESGSGFGIRVSGFGIQESGFVIRDSGFGIRDSGFGFQESGVGSRGTPPPRRSSCTWRTPPCCTARTPAGQAVFNM